MTKAASLSVDNRSFVQRSVLAGVALALACGVSGAQTLATGDARTVTEPTFPATVCTKIAAETTVTNAATGAVGSETDDTSIQSALSSCGSGNAVELTLNSNGNNAFVLAPITIPNGVTLIVDGGVTVFGSRNPADYQVTGGSTCGTSSGGGSGCKPLITIGTGTSGTHSTNVALMGYGVIDGRGEATMTSGANSGTSWWANGTTGGGSQNNPVLVSSTYSDSFTMYRITLRNSPLFHVTYKYGTGFTAWGIKVSTPFTAPNTDGVDPDQATNVTINNAYISDGDDDVAVGGTSSSPSSNVTFENSHVGSGHGASISDDGGNVSNVLVNNVTFSGQSVDSNEEAMHLKGNPAEGGSVSPTYSNITYENLCIENVHHPLRIDPFYDNSSGSTPATFSNIVVQNTTVLTEGQFGLQGYSANNLTTLTLNNFVYSAYKSSDITPTPQDITINLAGNVYPSALQTLTGSGVTYTGSATANSAPNQSCPTSAFPTLNAELYATTSTRTVGAPYALATTDAGSYTLNAVVQPVYAESSYTNASYTYTGGAAPSASVQFYDSFNGGTATAVGSPVALGQNGTLATLALSGAAVGTHSYTAQYLGDSNYGAITFGALTVTVTTGPAAQLSFTAAPASSVPYGSTEGTVAVAVQDAAGDTVTSSSAPVTLTVTGPSSYSATYGPVNASSGVATFSNVANLPMVGNYNFTATSNGLTSGSAGESVTAATLDVNAAAASRIFGQPNPSFVYAISGYVNGDGSGVVSGMPVLSTTALRNSPAGQYPIAEVQGSLAATNYVFLESGNTLTVNGGAAQVVNFYPLPNLANGRSYSLTATASSGLPVTYSVSGTGASINGSTLTLNSAASGQTITVTAAQSGNASYAAATSVVQSFVAQ